MIEVEGISKSFGETRALAGVDMSVPAGTVQGLLGPNGAGKTTLVRILATLLAPDTGRARVSGVDVQQDPNTVRSLIGLAGQYAAVDETLTGRENLVMVGRLKRLGEIFVMEWAAVIRDLVVGLLIAGAGDRLPIAPIIQCSLVADVTAGPTTDHRVLWRCPTSLEPAEAAPSRLALDPPCGRPAMW